jgi:pimeloyl-ACP methyl ester carboxylesterase
MAEAEMQKIEVNGVSLAFKHWGENNQKKLLLIAGWTGSKEIWGDFIPLLVENDFNVIGLDLRGEGDSDKPLDSEYNHEIFSKDIYAFMQSIGWDQEKFTFLGQSMGGTMALDYALRYPETLNYMVASNTSAYLSRNLVSKITWTMIINMYKKHPEEMMRKMTPTFFKYKVPQKLIDDFTAMSNKTPLHSGLKMITACVKTNMEPELHKITVPSLIISSEFDQKALRQGTLAIHKLIPGSTLVDIKKTGHLPFIENPKDFLKALVDFIQK